jgi:hypothetical protein
MTLEQQVCSLELAQKLKELGVKQESLFHWSRADNHGGLEVRYRQYVSEKDGEAVEHCSAFTVAELGEMLKPNAEHFKIFSSADKPGYFAAYHHGGLGRGETMADAAAAMLIYLLENKLLTNEKE